jgi:hypothetical protein
MAVAVVLAPNGQGFEQTCTRCHDPELRKRWGCDEPSEEPIAFLTPCLFCRGERDECEHCNGENRMPVHRCPNAVLDQAHFDVVSAVAMVERGVLPDAGGWQDQAAVFVSAFGLVTREIENWREVHREKAMRDAKRRR